MPHFQDALTPVLILHKATTYLFIEVNPYAITEMMEKKNTYKFSTKDYQNVVIKEKSAAWIL